MKRLIHILYLMFLTQFAFGQTIDSLAIDKIFASWDNSNSPGGAVGIIEEGKLIYARGYGIANLEHGITNSINSVFRVASISKQFTASCIVLLATQGKLNLDDPLDKFFFNFPDYAKNITIQHLLNHTSGIRDYYMISTLKGLEVDDYFTDEEVMEWLTSQQNTNFLPGNSFSYSNSGYWLLGQIVLKVTGNDLSEFAKKQIFEPLEMSDTHFHNNHNHIVQNRASGYSPSRSEGYEINTTQLDMIGAGGLFTTIRDLKKWDDAFYNSKIFNADFWNIMLEPGVLNNGEKLTYANGLNIGTYKGLSTIYHAGWFAGYISYYVRFPKQKFSVLVLANRDDARPIRMAYEIIDMFLSDKFISTTNQQSVKKIKQETFKLKVSELDAFKGHYWNAQNSYSTSIYVDNDTLRYKRSNGRVSALVPVSNNKYEMINMPDKAFVEFQKKSASVIQMTLTIGKREPSISNKYEPITYLKRQLEEFVGNYYSEELGVSYSFIIKDDLLILVVDNKVVSSMIPITTNVLANKYYGLFSFKENKANDKLGFMLTSGSIKNLIFVKETIGTSANNK